jgi:hypothetical protein
MRRNLWRNADSVDNERNGLLTVNREYRVGRSMDTGRTCVCKSLIKRGSVDGISTKASSAWNHHSRTEPEPEEGRFLPLRQKKRKDGSPPTPMTLDNKL